MGVPSIGSSDYLLFIYLFILQISLFQEIGAMELGIGNRTAGNYAVFDDGLKTEIVKRNRDRKNLKHLSI